jgi:hypothetical protein
VVRLPVVRLPVVRLPVALRQMDWVCRTSAQSAPLAE